MLNNTKHKSQSHGLLEGLDDQNIIKLGNTDAEAANAANIDAVKSTDRSIRRERRYGLNTGSSAPMWRVALW